MQAGRAQHELQHQNEYGGKSATLRHHVDLLFFFTGAVVTWIAVLCTVSSLFLITQCSHFSVLFYKLFYRSYFYTSQNFQRHTDRININIYDCIHMALSLYT